MLPDSIQGFVQDRLRTLGILAALVVASVCPAGASATLLLEEPYGKLGFFTATGHAAVYLSAVCADSPLVLRRCNPGETGIVISRYDGVAGYDWMAIPLIPYLYAVERPEDIPLFADAKMVAFLRDQYRRKYLEGVAPDGKDGETPSGNWYELVGTSYDRTVYGYEIATTAAQDDALIRKYNASQNQSHFHLVSNNCADFAKDVINFYYPHALHRSVIADVGITTPKQMAKLLVRFSARHPELQFAKSVIPQVPGVVPRSTAVHGVVESFFKSKKYIGPSIAVSPIFAGCVAAVYVSTGGGRFDPARDALVFDAADSQLKQPLRREDRRAYRKELSHLLADGEPETQDEASSDRRSSDQHESARSVEKQWERLQSRATPELDDLGRPVLNMQLGQREVKVGAAADNVLVSGAPPQLVQKLLAARLQAELRQDGPRSLSESEVARDWKLLQQAVTEDRAQSDASSPEPATESAFSSRLAHTGVNRP